MNIHAFTRAGLSLSTEGRGDTSFRFSFNQIVTDLTAELGNDFGDGMDRWTGLQEPYDFLNWSVYTLLDNSNIVQAVVGIYQVKERPSSEFWVGWFGVSHNYRKVGLGTALIHYIIDKAFSMGGEVLRLYTERNNIDAIRMYKRLGFLPTGLLSDFPPTQGKASGDSIVFTKFID